MYFERVDIHNLTTRAIFKTESRSHYKESTQRLTFVDGFLFFIPTLC